MIISKPIDKIVYSSQAPSNTNVMWVDDTDINHLTLYAHIGGLWRKVASTDEVDFERLTEEEVISLLQL